MAEKRSSAAPDHGTFVVVATAKGHKTSVQVEGVRPTEFVGTLVNAPLEDQAAVYLTADPEQLLIVRLLAPDFTRVGDYAYLRRADIPKEDLQQIDRLVAAKRARKRAQN